MQFGLFCAPSAGTASHGPDTGQGFHDWIDFNVEAERLGFHSTFLVEHHFTGWNQSSATLMMLACLAMRTTTLRVGTAVAVLPWHNNPVLLAEQVTTLDVMSKGRFDFGIGKGYRHNEFAGFMMAPEEADPRFEEAVEFLRHAFVPERFSFDGRFFKYDNIVIEPPPFQKPHPPYWVAAGNPHTIARAAGRGFNLILDQYASPATLGERIAIYKAAREAAGLSFNPMQVAVARQLYIAKDKADKEEALARQAGYTRRTIDASRNPEGKKEGAAGSHVMAYADRSGATEENALYGTPDEIRAMLEALKTAKVGYVIFTVAGGVDQLRWFAREIMPAFVGERAAAAE